MQRVKAAEAARELGVNRSTVSRWIKKHPALVDEDGLVSIEELRGHRDQVINPALQTRKSGTTDEAKDTGTAKKTGRNETQPPSLNDHRSRSAAADAVEKELNLAERLQLTLRRDRVEAALADAGQMMAQLAGQMARDKAETIARLEDTRAAERALDEMFREFLARAADLLAAAAKSDDRANAA